MSEQDCHDPQCGYQEPHKHGFACNRDCSHCGMPKDSDKGAAELRMIHVQVTDDLEACGVGIYEVHPNGHPAMPGSEGQEVGELLGAIRLENPEHCYEIAQRLTMCGIKIEEHRKRNGTG